MNKTELKEYLKENLEIKVEQEKGFYGEKHVDIILVLDGEQISCDSLDLDM